MAEDVTIQSLAISLLAGSPGGSANGDNIFALLAAPAAETVLPPNASTTIEIRCQPPLNESGAISAQLTITSDAAGDRASYDVLLQASVIGESLQIRNDQDIIIANQSTETAARNRTDWGGQQLGVAAIHEFQIVNISSRAVSFAPDRSKMEGDLPFIGTIRRW